MKSRLATPREIIVLTVIWLALLLTIDVTKNRHLWPNVWGAPPVAPASVPLSVWVNHLCCSGCLADASAALETLPWVEPNGVRPRARLESKEEAKPRDLGEYGGWVDVQVRDPALIDFVALDRALREKGLVPSRMELGGIDHFRLEAQLPHFCCSVCEDAAKLTSQLSRARTRGRLEWVDSVTSDRPGHRVIVHARYLEPGKKIDVAELLGAMDDLGLAPSSVRVLAGVEQAGAR